MKYTKRNIRIRMNFPNMAFDWTSKQAEGSALSSPVQLEKQN